METESKLPLVLVVVLLSGMLVEMPVGAGLGVDRLDRRGRERLLDLPEVFLHLPGMVVLVVVLVIEDAFFIVVFLAVVGVPVVLLLLEDAVARLRKDRLDGMSQKLVLVLELVQRLLPGGRGRGRGGGSSEEGREADDGGRGGGEVTHRCLKM